MRTATDLRITQAEHGALVTVRDMLMSGEIRYKPRDQQRLGNTLNVEISGGSDESGAVACIGGWVETFISGRGTFPSGVYKVDRIAAEAYVTEGRSPALVPLYYPLRTIHGQRMTRGDGEPFDYPWDLIEPREAAVAIDNFLLTGKPHWPDVLFDFLPCPPLFDELPDEPLFVEPDLFREAA